mgnify:CR=1 FL=1
MTGVQTWALPIFRVMGDLRRQGVAIIYISHRLEEVFELADTVTVLRDGRHVVTGPVTAFCRQSLIASMVGPPKSEMTDSKSQIGGACLGGGPAGSDQAASQEPALCRRAGPAAAGEALSGKQVPAPSSSSIGDSRSSSLREGGVSGGNGCAADARPAEAAAALIVRGLSRAGAFADVSFAVYRGEIVGLTGLVGAGRTELAQAVFGLVEAEAGEIGRAHG